MLLPQRRITFTTPTGQELVYDYLCDSEIITSPTILTDTAKLTFPRKLVYKSGDPLTPQNQNSQLDYVQPTAIGDTKNITYIGGQNATDAVFKRGYKVKIEQGFYPNLTTRFRGYISKTISTLPLQLHCEDEMWHLKQTNVIFPDPNTWVKTVKKKHTYVTGSRKLTLKQVMDGILAFAKNPPPYKLVDDNMDLGLRIFNNVSIAQVLEVLKSHYNLCSYFRDDGTLYVGFENNAQLTRVHEIIMDGPEGVVLNNDTLEWTNASDVNIKVRGISINADNTKIQYDAYMLDGVLVGKFIDSPSQEDKVFQGTVVTKTTYNQDKAGLKKFVDNLLPTLNYDGFRGDIITLGDPAVQHGDMIKLISIKMPERSGSYLANAIKINDGKDGYFQTITLGIALQQQT
jgi:hypothetical protein